MKPSLRPGVSRVGRIEVDRERTIGFMGEGGRVYGTPFLVRDIEMTCRQLVLDHADAGEDWSAPTFRSSIWRRHCSA